MDLYSDLPPPSSGDKFDLYADLPPAAGEKSSGKYIPPVIKTETPNKSSISTNNEKDKSIVNEPSNKLQSAVSKSKVIAPFKPRQAGKVATVPSAPAVKNTISHTSITSHTSHFTSNPQINNNYNEDSTKLNKSNIENDDMNIGECTTFDVTNPYEPSKPNDYLTWCEERIERKRLRLLEESNRKKLEEIEATRLSLEKERAEAVQSGDIGRIQATMSAGRGRGRGVTNLPSWMTSGNEDSTLVSMNNNDSTDRDNKSNSKNNNNNVDDEQFSDVGSKMMSRMGYQEGKGLGKYESGIVNPLEVQKIGNSKQAIIIQKNTPVPSSNSGGDNSMAVDVAESKETENTKKRSIAVVPSNVILLKNMVGPGEVDATLENEIKQECQNYGKVKQCIIRDLSMTRSKIKYPDNECVRIFILYDKQEYAVRAYKDLNGRYFGGRQITASFFSEDRFKMCDLEPVPGEW
jgi:splicing factor 45